MRRLYGHRFLRLSIFSKRDRFRGSAGSISCSRPMPLPKSTQDISRKNPRAPALEERQKTERHIFSLFSEISVASERSLNRPCRVQDELVQIFFSTRIPIYIQN